MSTFIDPVFAKALSPIKATEAGMLITANLLQLENALLPIETTDPGMLIVFKL